MSITLSDPLAFYAPAGEILPGAAYHVGDDILVEIGVQYVPGIVTNVAITPSPVRFGLYWTLEVSTEYGLIEAKCDDNGRNRTRTHGVMPA